jgi:hypothetical protein
MNAAARLSLPKSRRNRPRRLAVAPSARTGADETGEASVVRLVS